MEPVDLITRGHAAQRLLDDPMLQECLAMMEDGAVGMLKSADLNNTTRLQTLVMSLQAVSGFRGALENTLHSGKQALEVEEQKSLLSTVGGKLRRFVT